VNGTSRNPGQPLDQRSFDAWLADDAAPRLRLRSAALRMGSGGTPVVTHCALIGRKAGAALVADDAYAGAHAVEKVARLADSPSTGAAMLMSLAMKASRFDPTTPGVAGSVEAFADYVYKITDCPLFFHAIIDHITPQLDGSWESIIDHIIGCYDDVGPEDIDDLRQSFRTIAAAASSNPATNQTTNLFCQSTLKVDDIIDVYLYHSEVKMVSTIHHGGKHEPDSLSNHADLDICRIQLRFDAAGWPAQAERVHQMTQQSLRQWLEGGSTPAGGLPANWSPGRWSG
jgi:hypothetical protein